MPGSPKFTGRHDLRTGRRLPWTGLRTEGIAADPLALTLEEAERQPPLEVFELVRHGVSECLLCFSTETGPLPNLGLYTDS